ncbi:MAG: GAF domain-containing protein [Bacteroides sp.]
MKHIRINIRQRILFTVLIAVLLTYALSLGFLLYRNKANNIQTAIQTGRQQVAELAARLKCDINVSLTLARDLSNVMYGVVPQTWEAQERELDRAIQQIVASNYLYSEIMGTFDLKLKVPDYAYKEGQYEVIYPFNDSSQRKIAALRDTSGYITNLSYIEYRNYNEEKFLEPYLLRPDTSGKVHYVVGISVPVRDSAGEAIGVIAINRQASYYRKKFAEYHPYPDMSVFLFSSNMKVIAGPEDELIGQDAREILAQVPEFTDKVLLMRQGVVLAQSYVSPMTSKESFLFSAPIYVGDIRHPWTICMVVSHESLLAFSDETVRLTVWLTAISLLILIIVLIWLSTSIGSALHVISNTLKKIAAGHIDEELHLPYHSHDEIGDIASYTNLLLDRITAKVAIAQAIGRGEQNKDYKAEEEDVLGCSLVELQKSLHSAKEREAKQRLVEEEQAWATQGLARFSEYMRVETTDIVGFTYDILHHLAHYVKADIGAVYLCEKDEEDKTYLKLTSAYAYEVRKYADVHFYIGDGLVGRCAMEQHRIYITELPKGYVKITSGLGHEAPNSLVLIPIMMNDVLQGVLELARFGEFAEYVLKFIENVVGSFAATLVALRNNIQTQQLLQEARIRSEEISAQEEEMRQNLEELQTIQEEVARKSAEMESWNRAMQSACCIVEYDTRGYLTFANNEFLSLLRISLAEIQNHHHSEGIDLGEDQLRNYQNFWQDLLNGQVKRNIRNHIHRNNIDLIFTETYAPIFNEHHQVVKILKIAFNITDFVTQESPQASEPETKE